MKVSNLLRSIQQGIGTAADVLTKINDAFATVRTMLQNNISFSDNIFCDVVTATFDSGVALSCKLTHLKSAKGAIVVGSSAPCIASPLVSMNGEVATVTLFFAGMAKSVTATVILVDVGTVGSPHGSVIATNKLPGILRPDGTSCHVDDNGVLSVP